MSLTIRVQAAPCRLCLVEITFCCREQQRLASRSVSRSLEEQRTETEYAQLFYAWEQPARGGLQAAGGHLKGGTWHRVDNAGFSSGGLLGTSAHYCHRFSQHFCEAFFFIARVCLYLCIVLFPLITNAQ